MPRKRPSAGHRTSSSSSSEDVNEGHPSKRLRSSSYPSDDDNTKPIQVYIVDAKLDQQIYQELRDLVQQTGHQPADYDYRTELCSDISLADIVITNIRMRKRLERHLNWKIACEKAIVTPAWLRESVKQHKLLPCGDFAAITDLVEETVKHCPESEGCASHEASLAANSESSSEPPDIVQRYKPLPVKPTDPEVFKNWRSRYSCTRASPLICPNQELVSELDVLCRSRELEGLRINALSYERSLSIIKSYPYKVNKETFRRDIKKLPGLGDKTLSKIEEYLENGFIKESRTTRQAERYQTLTLFSSIYGVGPSTARKLYDTGLRTIEDLERYYDVAPGMGISALEESDLVTPNGIAILPKDKLPDISIKVALALREELDIKIPRDEVEEMHAVVMAELEQIQSGCVSTVVGGYRRGKPESNDMDIIISHAELKGGADLVKGLCTKVTRRLYQRGLVTHVMHLSGFHAHDALKTEHWDSLEKALTVFILPLSSKRKRIHRRLDLIFASPEAYWTAVIGWSGSKMFQRDLRLWAKQEKGMKFDSAGLTRRRDSKLYIPRNEEEVFQILGLRWVDPTMRNADL